MILLREFIKSNVNLKMITKNVSCAESNTRIASVILNMKMLKMI